jgi:hypothetical protein
VHLLLLCSNILNTHSGDPAIPIVDLDFHNDGSASKEDYHWLLDEYNWKAIAAGYFMDLEAEKTSAHITGFGAMPNCHMRLKNIAESVNTYDTAGITRGDPGIGAFTGYHNRTTRALKDIRAGQELYVDYGPAWFLSRESYMVLINHMTFNICCFMMIQSYLTITFRFIFAGSSPTRSKLSNSN